MKSGEIKTLLIKTAVALLIVFLFLSQSAFAFQGEMKLRALLGSDEKVNSDFYVLGWRADVEGEVNGNLFVLGGTVHVHGPVHGNVYAAGGIIYVDGPVDGDINLIGFTAETKSKSRACRILALDANHFGKTSRDLLSLGMMVGVRDQVGGDTVIGGWWTDVEGTHHGRLLALARSISVSGTIDGDADLKADSITIGDAARFKQNLSYTNARELDIPAKKVEGEITHNFPSPALPPGFHFAWLYVLSHKMFSALWLTVVGLVSLTWFPRSSQSVVDTMLHFPWESFFTGLALIVAIPGIAFVLLVSFLGIPLGIFLFVIFAVAVYLTRLFGSLYIGERLLGALEHRLPPYWQSLPLGVFLFTLLTSIPYFGLAVSLVVIPLALGAKALLGWRVYRRMRSRHLA